MKKAVLLCMAVLLLSACNNNKDCDCNDADKPIARKLPKVVTMENENPAEIQSRNIFVVSINEGDQLFFNGEIGEISQLKNRIKEFLNNPNDLSSLSEKEIQQIEGLGYYPVSKGVVSLQCHFSTSYDTYFRIQNELTAAIEEMREKLSMDSFGKSYSSLSDDQRKAIETAIPMAISEANPER